MRRALVTGANRGIGAAIAQGLAALGLEVIVGSRDLAAGQTIANQIGAQAIALDVSDPANIAQAVADAGPIDVLVNNAGILGQGSVLDDPVEFSASMDVMVRGPYLLMHHLVPHMQAQNYGRIVNLSSGWGSFAEGLQGPASYGVAKAALNALTVASAATLPGTIKVNAMCPGWVRTRMGGSGATRSPEQGADTAIWLATLDQNGPTGGFFRDRASIDW